MNVTNLEVDLQKQAKKCFNSFKNDIKNYPLKDQMTNEDLLEFSINNSIHNDFRGSWMNNYMSSNLSDAQMKLYNDKINYYKNITIRIGKNWAKKYFVNLSI